MSPDLPILNAMQYDIGIPPSTAARAARGSKRKITASTPRTVDPAGNATGHDSSHIHEPTETNKEKLKRPAKALLLPDSDDEGEGEQDELDQGGKKRARGRPRIDIKDATAAERRRTQIRLAQRAYRNRKEWTIASLEKKVQSLKDANEAMSHAFMRLHDFAVDRGLLETSPDLATQLRQTTEVFLEMARQSGADEEDKDDEDGSLLSTEVSSKDAPPTTADNTSQAIPSPHGSEDVESYEKRQRSIADAVMTFGYQTQHVVVDLRHPHEGHAHAQLPELSQQMALPQMPLTRQVHDQMYSGILFHQHQHQSPNLSARSYIHTDGAGGFFGMVSDHLEPVGASSSEPSVSGQAPFSSHMGSNGMANMPSNGRSSNNSALSLSPASEAQGYAFTAQLEMINGTMPSYPSYSSAVMPTSTSDIAPHLANTHEFMSTAAIGSPSTLPLPTRYPVDVPFGQRLSRLAIQAAYNLINTPDPEPDLFARVFGLCIMYEQPGQICQRLRRSLEAPIHYTSKSNKWELPFATHTPDPAGGAYARAPSRSQGPNNSNSNHSGTNVRPVVPLINITVPGFEGTFFDCEEIEMYLQQRGVHIPPNTHNVIVEVDDTDFAVNAAAASTNNRGSQSSTGSSSVVDNAFGAVSSPTSSGGTGTRYAVPTSNRTAKTANAMDWDLDSGPSVMATITAATGRGSDASMSENATMMASMMSMDSFASFQRPDQAQQQQQQQHNSPVSPPRRLLTLDVDKFLHELIGRGSCLGQTPGFREADVNEAFWSSTQSAS